MRMLFMLLILAIFTASAVPALSATLNEAGDDRLVTNETWSPSAGSVTTLERSNLDNTVYDDDVVVRDDGNNRTYEGDDYVWFESNGTVKAVAGGELDGDSSATISYAYQTTTAEQRGFAAMFAQIPNVMGMALPVFALLFLLVVVRG